VLGSAAADVVAPVSLAPGGDQFARELSTYKRTGLTEGLRRRRTVGLAAVLWRWLDVHERCLASRVGVGRFDVLTSVPSTTGRVEHPLRRLVAGVVAGGADRYADLVAIDRTDVGQRTQAVDRFRATRDLTGGRVLVVDDTWTTGAHAQSASAALKAAGAIAVGIVVLGRWINPEYGENDRWLADQRRIGWNWGRCCLDEPPRR
jgi:phosphoribosylpyrophosphate synthetase